MSTEQKILPSGGKNSLTDPALVALRIAFLKRGVTDAYVAKRLGVSVKTIQNVKSGQASRAVRNGLEKFFRQKFWSGR